MSDEPPSSAQTGGSHVTEELNPEIGLLGALAIGVGTMIAAGIFVLSGLAVSNVGAVAIGSFSVQAVDEGLMVNSGTWLKRLHRRESIIGLLPPVFYPSYQLTAVRIAAEETGVTVDFEAVEKPSPAPEELTLTERLLTLGRQPTPELPGRAVVEGGAPQS